MRQALNTKGNTKMAKRKVSANWFIQTRPVTKGIGVMGWKTGTESTITSTGTNMRGNGNTIDDMEEENTITNQQVYVLFLL